MAGLTLSQLETDHLYARGQVIEFSRMAREYQEAGDVELYHFAKAAATNAQIFDDAIYRRLKAKREELEGKRRKRRLKLM